MEVQEGKQQPNQIVKQFTNEATAAAEIKLENNQVEVSGDGNVYTDIMSNERVKIAIRVRIPEKEHPKYNFIGKLIGPKGSTMKQLQSDTGTRISILGRNSMRDKAKEEELRNSSDPKYSHLTNDLHVMVEANCPTAEAYGRIGHALMELKKYLTPDPDDEIRQGQLMEMGMISGQSVRGGMGRGRGSPGPGRGMVRPMGAGPQAMSPPFSRGGPRGSPRGRGVMAGRGRAATFQPTEQEYYVEQPYDGSFKTGYEDTTGKVAGGTGDYGYGGNPQTNTYGATPSPGGGASYGSGVNYGGNASFGGNTSYPGYGAGGAPWGSGSGGAAQRMKTPSQGYAMKPAARNQPYARY